MDCPQKAAVYKVMEAVLEEYQEALEGAGTLWELEGVLARIGEEVSHRIGQEELQRRAEQTAAQEAACPDCGTLCGSVQREPTVLEGQHGRWCYEQPKYYCRRCRRHFFPDGGGLGHRGPCDG